MRPVKNFAHITEFLALRKSLLARLYLLYLTENLKPYMEYYSSIFVFLWIFMTLKTYL